MSKVKRAGLMDGIQGRMENGAKRGLILGGTIVAQRGTEKAHVVSGRLKRDIHRGNPYVIRKGIVAINIGSNLAYAIIEELRPGEKNGTPHSFLRPALNESARAAKFLFARNVIRAMMRGV